MLLRPFFDSSYLADFEAYCPFGGLMAFSSFLVNKSLACSMTSVQIAMGIVFIAGIILFSKLFCSFICPVGSISEWLGKVGDKLKIRITVSGNADLILRFLKYLLLFITAYFTITSSELFCRKFDPYYAALTGFGGDVRFLWGLLALIIVVAGSVFIRLFWCKYLCPVGAISNIFRFVIIFILVFGIYILLIRAGLEISFIWPLAIVCEAAFLAEVLTMESKIFPLVKIRRHQDVCTNCRLCSVNCPQAIDVASMSEVKHIDCHLCGDCVHNCPENGALTVNRRGKKWLPALITVLLITAGLFIGMTFEIPTLSLYWGDESGREKMELFTKSGLKNIKCFGSSTSFANQMRSTPGVYGVTTMVKTNTAIISFNPAETDTLAILKAIFTPVKIVIRRPDNDTSMINVYSLKIENFFDPLDAGYLKQLLSGNMNILGFTTDFDCPVKVTIYSAGETQLSPGDIKEIVESPSTTLQYTDGSTSEIKLKFRVKEIKLNEFKLSAKDYLSLIAPSN